MTLEEKEKIVNDIIDIIDGVDVTDCHLSDYQREILDGIIEAESTNPWIVHASQCSYRFLVDAIDEVLEPFLKDIEMATTKSPRTIADVKKDIKHEKNPMRLKQLNKELNKLYREKKRKELKNNES